MSKHTLRTSASTHHGHQRAHNKGISKHTIRTGASTHQGHQQALNKVISKHTPRTSASTQQSHQQALKNGISKHTIRTSASTQQGHQQVHTHFLSYTSSRGIDIDTRMGDYRYHELRPLISYFPCHWVVPVDFPNTYPIE